MRKEYKSKLKTVICESESEVHYLVQALIENSMWFQVEPWPEGRWQVTTQG